jgi:hypothetical protein
MPRIEYAGRQLTVDVAYSYARVSSKRQEIEGHGIDRQMLLSREWSTRYGVPLDSELADLGKSGSKGHHIRQGNRVGALGGFLDLIHSKPRVIKPNSVLLVESFSRLVRLPILDAMSVFEQIVNNGVALITLQDKQVYTKQLIDQNAGMMHTVLALMQAARTEAESRSHYAELHWKTKRRGTALTNLPSWIVRDGDKLVIDEDKAVTIRRIFQDVLTYGVNTIAASLNKEGIPRVSSRKPTMRSKSLWDGAFISSLIRGKQVLGIQEVGSRINGKRVLSGDVIENALPPVIKPAQWERANSVIASRQVAGAFNGRNQNQTNLFGSLALCGSCGGRMIVRNPTSDRKSHYLGCSMAKAGTCTVKTYFRIDTIERHLQAEFGQIVCDDSSDENERTIAIAERLALATGELRKLEQRYENMFEQFADDPGDGMAKQTLAKWATQIKDKRSSVEKQKRELQQSKGVAKADQLGNVKTWWNAMDGLYGEKLVEARAKIAAALPSVLKFITFMEDGSYSIELANGAKWIPGSIMDFYGPVDPGVVDIMRKRFAMMSNRRNPPADPIDAGERSQAALKAFRKQGFKKV